MSAEIARVLRDAADLIEPEGRWTRGEAARDADGRKVLPSDPAAVCWCGAGAIRRAAEPNYFIGNGAIECWSNQIKTWLVGSWNDGQESVEPVVATLRAAADEAERV